MPLDGAGGGAGGGAGSPGAIVVIFCGFEPHLDPSPAPFKRDAIEDEAGDDLHITGDVFVDTP